jgi:hypothetical protein
MHLKTTVNDSPQQNHFEYYRYKTVGSIILVNG